MSTIREEIRALSATTKDLRSFGLTVGAALVVFWIVLWKVFPFVFGRGGNFPWLAYIGVALAAVGAVAPVVLKPVFYGWMSLAFVLSFVMTRVILTIFFGVYPMPILDVTAVSVENLTTQVQTAMDAVTQTAAAASGH